jgi:hypothetical protein
MRRTTSFVAVLFGFLAGLGLAPACAQTPCDELVRLVPDDVGICLVVRDLRGHVRAVLDSPFADLLRRSPIAVAVRAGPESRKLEEAERYFRDHFQVDWARLLDDVFGDAVVLAFWPGPPGQADQERGLVLLRARDPDLLARLQDRLAEVMKQAGNGVTVAPRTHRDVVYTAWNDGKKASFVYRSGGLLAVTHQEELLQQLIDRQRSPAQGATALERQLRRLGLADALAALWFNPRAFDPEIEQKTAQAPGVDEAARRNILAHWKALEGAALAANVRERELEIEWAFLVHEAQLPDAARLFFRTGRPSELWQRFPEHALLTVAGRVDMSAVAELVRHFLGEPARRAVQDALDRYGQGSLGRDVVKEVFPGLGPDWGFCVIPPGPEGKTWVPHLLGAVRVQSGGEDPPLDRALFHFLNSVGMLAVIAHNAGQPDKMTLRTEMQGNVEVKYFTLEKGFPLGVRPAFALKDGYLVFGSSPDVVRQFGGPRPSQPAPDAPECPWVRLSVQRLRAYLADHADALADHIAAKEQIPLDEARRRLTAVGSVLELFDQVEIGQRSTSDQLHLTARVRTSVPLRK